MRPGVFLLAALLPLSAFAEGETCDQGALRKVMEQRARAKRGLQYSPINAKELKEAQHVLDGLGKSAPAPVTSAKRPGLTPSLDAELTRAEGAASSALQEDSTIYYKSLDGVAAKRKQAVLELWENMTPGKTRDPEVLAKTVAAVKETLHAETTDPGEYYLINYLLARLGPFPENHAALAPLVEEIVAGLPRVGSDRLALQLKALNELVASPPFRDDLPRAAEAVLRSAAANPRSAFPGLFLSRNYERLPEGPLKAEVLGFFRDRERDPAIFESFAKENRLGPPEPVAAAAPGPARVAALAARPKAEELAKLKQDYPKLFPRLAEMRQALLDMRPDLGVRPVSRIEEIPESVVLRRTEATTDPVSAWKDLDPRLRDTIVGVFNKLLDREAFADYVEDLALRTAIAMSRTPERATPRHANFPAPFGEVEWRETKDTNGVTRRQKVMVPVRDYLAEGILDHNSLQRTLVADAKARGLKVAVIPTMENGNWDQNHSRTMKFERFFDVPAYGPFFDAAFGRNAAHGQDTHMLQMMYLQDYVSDLTGGHPELFWRYATSPKGSWVWDTFMDGWNNSAMGPEFIGPFLERFLPLH